MLAVRCLKEFDRRENIEARREREEKREALEKVRILRKNKPCGLKHEAPRLPKPSQETFWTPKGPRRAPQGWFWEALGALPGRS